MKINIEMNNGNLLSFLLRCGTRPYERGTQWDSNSLESLIFLNDHLDIEHLFQWVFHWLKYL